MAGDSADLVEGVNSGDFGGGPWTAGLRGSPFRRGVVRAIFADTGNAGGDGGHQDG